MADPAVEKRVALSDLVMFEQMADRMVLFGMQMLGRTPPVNDRERAFASALIRNAKGVRVACAAWSQELHNT